MGGDYRRKRGVIEILGELLSVLLEERAASKTRLTNRANLNLASFKRYIELLERAGAVATQVDDSGRLVYAATPRTGALLLMVRLLERATRADPTVVKRYLGVVGETVKTLVGEGFMVRLGRVERVEGIGESVFYDMVVVGKCSMGILLSLMGDPLNPVRLWTLAVVAAGYRPAGIDSTLVASSDEMVSRVAEKLGFPLVEPTAGEILDAVRRGCG